MKYRAIHMPYSSQDKKYTIPVEQLKQYFQMRELGNTPELLAKKIAGICRDELLVFLTTKDEFGMTIFHHAMHNIESLEMLLKATPEDQRFAILTAKNVEILHFFNRDQGSHTITLPAATLLEQAAGSDSYRQAVIGHPDALKMVLDYLPANKRLDAIRVRCRWGITTAHYAARDSKLLATLLDYIPENERLNIFSIQDDDGKSAFKYARLDPRSLNTIFKAIPFNLQLIKRLKESGLNVRDVKKTASPWLASLLFDKVYPWTLTEENSDIFKIMLTDLLKELQIQVQSTSNEDIKQIVATCVRSFEETQIIDQQHIAHLRKNLQKVRQSIHQEEGLWHQIHPIIKATLGILAGLTILPALVVSSYAERGFSGTFFKSYKTDLDRAITANTILIESVRCSPV